MELFKHKISSLWLGIVLVIVSFGAVGFSFFPVDFFNSEPREEVKDEIPVTLTTYRNEAYQFELTYPAHWVIAEFPDDPIAPMFNVYKPVKEDDTFPLTHFSEATHVSIYPKGIPTEGEFGTSVESSIITKEEVRVAIDYVFEDGKPYATFIGFRNQPPSWGEAGFAWAKVRRENLETTCSRKGVVIGEEKCDPLSGDTVTHKGTINDEDRILEEQMLASFTFIKNRTSVELDDLIHVKTPKAGEYITSPLLIEGEARGTWYFEATFPIVLVDWDGRIIAESYAEAQDEWMTEEFVPFKAELKFTKPPYEGTDYGERGALILKKDNPSGLPEHDRAIEIPIRFR